MNVNKNDLLIKSILSFSIIYPSSSYRNFEQNSGILEISEFEILGISLRLK